MGSFRKSNLSGQVVTSFTLDDAAVTAAKIAAGAVSASKLSLAVRNETGSTITAGSLVHVSGWSEAQGRFLITKADADAAGKPATWILQADLTTATNGTAYKRHRLTTLNTDAGVVSDPVYLHTTAGSWTLTAPTAANARKQVVGFVAVKSATVGEIEFDLTSVPAADVVGTNELQALSVDTAQLAAGAVNASKLSLAVRNETGSTITAGSLVHVSGWSEAQGRFLITKADADAAGKPATWILQADLTTATNGTAYKRHRLTGQNTAAAGAAGDPVYLHTTAGAWTLTGPTAANARKQIVGFVAVKDAAIGEIEFDLTAVKSADVIGTNELQGLSVDTAEIAASAVTLAKVAPGTMDGTIALEKANANVIGALPVIHRITLPSGANASTDVVLTHKTRIIFAWWYLKAAGTAGSTVTVKNGANAISDAVDVSAGGDKDLFHVGEMDDATHEIAASGTLRVATASAGGDFPGAEAYVLGIRVA